jgi:hypothetical protein
MVNTADRSTAPHRPVRPRVAAALAFGLLLLVAFQAALTFGAPFGQAALGGANAGQLPPELRMVTAVATLAWLVATLVVLARGGLAVSFLPRAVSWWGTWLVVCVLALGALLNFASSSPWERFGWGPFTLTMLVLCTILARSGYADVGEPQPSQRRRRWALGSRGRLDPRRRIPGSHRSDACVAAEPPVRYPPGVPLTGGSNVS